MSLVPRRLLTGAAVAGGLAATGTAALRHPVFGGTPSGDRLARMEASPQWRDGRFQHPTGSRLAGPSPAMLWKWIAGTGAVRTPTGPVPTVARTRADFEAPQDLRVTWLGHATALLEVAGVRLLTDPVFSKNASPGPLFGVPRFFEPPLPLGDLPDLDAVLITHDHYDHLDYKTVARLAERIPRWIAPLGVGAHLERWGVPPDRITELDWWDEATVAGAGGETPVRIVATPSRHFSGRALTGRDRTLWCGFAVVGAERRVYLTGDGGMQREFAEVGRRLGPFDVTLAEAGAYNADWADIHLGPEQAVAAVRAARGGLMLPVHWGTFNLAFHGWTEPAERVLAAADAAGVRVVVPRPGESVSPDEPPAVERWWPEIAWQTVAEAPVVSAGLDYAP